MKIKLLLLIILLCNVNNVLYSEERGGESYPPIYYPTRHLVVPPDNASPEYMIPPKGQDNSVPERVGPTRARAAREKFEKQRERAFSDRLIGYAEGKSYSRDGSKFMIPPKMSERRPMSREEKYREGMANLYNIMKYQLGYTTRQIFRSDYPQSSWQDSNLPPLPDIGYFPIVVDPKTPNKPRAMRKASVVQTKGGKSCAVMIHPETGVPVPPDSPDAAIAIPAQPPVAGTDDTDAVATGDDEEPESEDGDSEPTTADSTAIDGEEVSEDSEPEPVEEGVSESGEVEPGAEEDGKPEPGEGDSEPVDEDLEPMEPVEPVEPVEVTEIEYDASNSPGKSEMSPLPYEIDGSVGFDSDDDDYFRVAVRSNAILKVFLTELSDNLYLSIYEIVSDKANENQESTAAEDSDGTDADSGENSDNSDETYIKRIETAYPNRLTSYNKEVSLYALAGKTYVVRVTPYGEAESNYRLNIKLVTYVPAALRARESVSDSDADESNEPITLNKASRQSPIDSTIAASPAGRGEYKSGADAGNTKLSAMSIPVPYLLKGSVGYGADKADFFRFIPINDGFLSIFLTNLSENVFLLFYEHNIDDGVYVLKKRTPLDKRSNSSDKKILYNVLRETIYLVAVVSENSAKSDYQLLIDLEMSKPKGANEGDYVYSAILEEGEDGKIKIAGGEDVNSGSGDGPLEDDNAVIAIEQRLEMDRTVTKKGEYVTGEDAGNTKGSAMSIPVPRSIKGSLGFDGDRVDYFRFIPTKNGHLRISLTGLSGNAYLRFYEYDIDKNSYIIKKRTPLRQRRNTSDKFVLYDVVEEKIYLVAVRSSHIKSPKLNYNLDLEFVATNSGDGSGIAAEDVEVANYRVGAVKNKDDTRDSNRDTDGNRDENTDRSTEDPVVDSASTPTVERGDSETGEDDADDNKGSATDSSPTSTDGRADSESNYELDLNFIKPEQVGDPDDTVHGELDPTITSKGQAPEDLDGRTSKKKATSYVTVEIFSSEDKASDGPKTYEKLVDFRIKRKRNRSNWLVKVAEAFNKKKIELKNGQTAQVKIRKVPSDIAYHYITSGKHVPHAYSPSCTFWSKMLEFKGTKFEVVTDKLVSDRYGIAIKWEEAQQLKAEFNSEKSANEDQSNASNEAGEVNQNLDFEYIVSAIQNGRLQVGYTNPFNSCAGYSYLNAVMEVMGKQIASKVTVERNSDWPWPTSQVERFADFIQESPLNAFSLDQLRHQSEFMERFDGFVSDYKFLVSSPSTYYNYQFVPFGPPQNTPLYAIGDIKEAEMEALKAFSSFAVESESQKIAKMQGYNRKLSVQPQNDDSNVGDQLQEGDTDTDDQSQNDDTNVSDIGDQSQDDPSKLLDLWKAKKDADREIIAVFLVDLSATMAGAKLRRLKKALIQSSQFIDSKHQIGLVSFNEIVNVDLPIGKYDETQKGRFINTTRFMIEEGDTAMYNGILVSLDMITKAVKSNPNATPMLFVLADGPTNRGYTFNNPTTQRLIDNLGIPIYTFNYEGPKGLHKLKSKEQSLESEMRFISNMTGGAYINTNRQTIILQLRSLFKSIF